MIAEHLKARVEPWRWLFPYPVEEPGWLAFAAKLAGAVLALALLLQIFQWNLAWQLRSEEQVIEGTIRTLAICDHRNCGGKRWRLYLEGHDELINLPFEKTYRVLEAAGDGQVRAHLRGNMLRRLSLDGEPLLRPSEARAYQSGLELIMTLARNKLLSAGLPLWIGVLLVRVLRRRI